MPARLRGTRRGRRGRTPRAAGRGCAARDRVWSSGVRSARRGRPRAPGGRRCSSAGSPPARQVRRAWPDRRKAARAGGRARRGDPRRTSARRSCTGPAAGHRVRPVPRGDRMAVARSRASACRRAPGPAAACRPRRSTACTCVPSRRGRGRCARGAASCAGHPLERVGVLRGGVPGRVHVTEAPAFIGGQGCGAKRPDFFTRWRAVALRRASDICRPRPVCASASVLREHFVDRSCV